MRLWITDEGPGLAPEDASRVFDRFFRAGGGAGSGLGMAIVQGVVRAHGGQVSVKCAENMTVFTVQLPRHYRGDARQGAAADALGGDDRP